MEALRKLECDYCRGPKPVLACSFSECTKLYHYLCAVLARGEYSNRDCIFQFYCSNHKSIALSWKLDSINWKQITEWSNIQYATTNDWSRISKSDRRFLRNNLTEHFLKYDPKWFYEQLYPTIGIKEIFSDHWAWCTKLEKRNLKQYEAVALKNFKKDEVICEYVGEVHYSASKESDYTVCFWLPDCVKNNLKIPFLCIDSLNLGNEARFINTITATTPKYVKQNASMHTYCVKRKV
eukprot:TRINITY_DN3341_c0_g1_i1.p1 TRINITY_DN3341_c0_g1~~TRINITY_DN3341_c0_g1_i1.p1  ORF type:complete len:270 (+),score=31.59 TRINITY_DN3341_c0_g1_i1:100-810(+)